MFKFITNFSYTGDSMRMGTNQLSIDEWNIRWFNNNKYFCEANNKKIMKYKIYSFSCGAEKVANVLMYFPFYAYASIF
jgi:hypothetical protein